MTIDISTNQSNLNWIYSYDEETYGDFLVIEKDFLREGSISVVTTSGNPYAKTFSVPVYISTEDNVATTTITIYYTEPADPRLNVDESTR
jgi:hypothetical protein